MRCGRRDRSHLLRRTIENLDKAKNRTLCEHEPEPMCLNNPSIHILHTHGRRCFVRAE